MTSGLIKRILRFYVYPQYLFAKRIADECNKSRGQKVLLIDAPCGNGETSFYFAKKMNAIVKAYDISEQSISIAKNHYKLPNLDFYKKDIFDAIEENDSIDVFCIINSLFLLTRPEELLIRLRSKLKDDGELFIIVPNILGENFKKFQIHQPNVNLFQLTSEKFDSYFQKLGYKVLLSKPIAYTPWFKRKDAEFLKIGAGIYLNSISFFKEKFNIGHGNYFLIKLIKKEQEYLLFTTKQTLLTKVMGKLKMQKQKLNKISRIYSKQIKKEYFIKNLSDVGIKKGDTLLVHSSLSKIGNVHDGPNTIIETLVEQVGNTGNVVMPAFSYIDSMLHTTQERNYVFDPLSTTSKVGIISEEFRKWPNVKRSIHPTHSVCAYGPLATLITEGHLNAITNFGIGTPFHRIRELKGKIVGIGINIGPVTIYHSAEDFYPEQFGKVYLSKPQSIKVRVNGIETVKSIFIHDPKFHSVRIDKNKMIERWMRNHFKEKSILHEGAFGSGTIWWMDIQELFDELLSLAKRGISIYKVPKI